MLNDEDFLILTGSDSTHFNSLVNLLKTLVAFEPNTEVVIINLGMCKNEIQYLETNFNYQIKEFNFEEYPRFVSRRDEFDKLGAYAWKPISIYNEFNETEKCTLARCGLPDNQRVKFNSNDYKEKMDFILHSRVLTILYVGLMKAH